MKTKRPIPLKLALLSLEFKRQSGLLPPDNTSLLHRLLGEGEEKKRPHRDAATVTYDPEIAEHPANMHEALQRQHHLVRWLKDGFTIEDFYKRFNPEK
ncbi:MAG: hypothetical protein AAB937_01015 [Patescibacteria group bacterium]